MQTPEGRRFRQSTQDPEARISFDAKRMEKQTRSTKAENFSGGNDEKGSPRLLRKLDTCMCVKSGIYTKKITWEFTDWDIQKWQWQWQWHDLTWLFTKPF